MSTETRKIPETKKLLIIGCGDIGERLAAALPRNVYNITGLRRSAVADSDTIHYRVCDVSDAVALECIIQENFEFIVITMTPSQRTSEGYEQAYVQTLRNVIDSLERHKLMPARIIFVSSTGVYGQQDGSWVDETSPTEPENFRGERLLEAETLLAQSKLTSTIVRFSGIYGPGRLRLIEQVERGHAVLSASYTNRIHADDCAGVLAHLIEKHRGNEAVEPLYLATDSAPTPMAEVVAWLSMQLKVNRALFAPDSDEQSNKRCSNKRLLHSGYVFRYPDFRAGYLDVLKSMA